MQKVCEARATIRRHIKSRGNDSCYQVTENMIAHWFRLLNAAVFSNQLPTPREFLTFEYKNRDSTLGFCRHQNIKNTISIAVCKEFDDRRTFLTVLVHEMVHMYQAVFRTRYSYHSRMTHGKSFYDWQDTVKRTVGLGLSEYIEV